MSRNYRGALWSTPTPWGSLQTRYRSHPARPNCKRDIPIDGGVGGPRPLRSFDKLFGLDHLTSGLAVLLCKPMQTSGSDVTYHAPMGVGFLCSKANWLYRIVPAPFRQDYVSTEVARSYQTEGSSHGRDTDGSFRTAAQKE